MNMELTEWISLLVLGFVVLVLTLGFLGGIR